MKTTFVRWALLTCALMVSSFVLAAPNVLTVAGLAPGVSTRSDVERLRSDWGYIIGGFRLSCDPYFDNKFLTKLVCSLGVSRGSRILQSFDTVKNEKVDARGVLTELSVAYLIKYDKPVIDRWSSVNTKDMGEVVRVLTVWEDQQGNTLSLMWPWHDLAEEGVLVLESFADKGTVGTRNY